MPEASRPEPDRGAEINRVLKLHALRLRRGFDAGRRHYGDLGLDYGVYAPRVVAVARARLSRGGGAAAADRLGEVLDQTVLDDLYLAIACDEGIAAGWETLHRDLPGRLAALADRRGAAAGEAQDLAQDILGDLLTPAGRSVFRTHLGTYEGAGTLFSWVSGILLRKLFARRKKRPSSQLLPDEAANVRQTPSGRGLDSDPADAAGDAEQAERTLTALQEAWRRLTPREGLAIVLKFREGLPQTGIARILDVGEPRVTRLIQSAVGKIQEVLRRGPFLGIGDGGAHLWASLRTAIETHLASSRTVPPLPVRGAIRGQETDHGEV